MGQHGERWRVEHDIKVQKVENDFPSAGFIVFLLICLLLGLMFGQ